MSDLLALVAALGGGVGVGGLVRVYIRHRTRLQVERERSARARARAAELVRLAGIRRQLVRIDERDCDGHRIVEIGIRRIGVVKNAGRHD